MKYKKLYLIVDDFFNNAREKNNVGGCISITAMTCNEVCNSQRPDTFLENVITAG